MLDFQDILRPPKLFSSFAVTFLQCLFAKHFESYFAQWKKLQVANFQKKQIKLPKQEAIILL